MITKDKVAPAKHRGDVVMVTRMAMARGLNKGRGYSLSYVQKVLTGERANADIVRLHGEVVKMRQKLYAR